VHLHGGKVTAHSAGLGRGSEVVVRLPMDRGASPCPVSTEPASGRTKRRVLIIEDNADAATSLQEVLQLGAHEVEVARNGPDGVKKAHAFLPDVVLCDIGLPGMDGYAVARTLRADPRLRRIHLIALSGYALPEDLQRSAEAGFEQHLAKPPSVEQLESILDGLSSEPSP